MKLIRRGLCYAKSGGNYFTPWIEKLMRMFGSYPNRIKHNMPYVQIVDGSNNRTILAKEAIESYSNPDGSPLKLRQIQSMEPLQEMDITYRSE